MLKLTIFLCALALAATTKRCHAQSADRTYDTKFGQFTQDYKSTNFFLNGKVFASKPMERDADGFSVDLSFELFGEQYSSTTRDIHGKPYLERAIVAYNGGGGGCFRHFLVIDFTGAKPFVSAPFGYNPDGTACLKFVNVNWGVDQSTITLDGPDKFIYRANGTIVGPVD
jgi:hypothetical protein